MLPHTWEEGVNQLAFDFPASPTVGQTYQPAGGPLYQFNGYAWVSAPVASGFMSMKRSVFTALGTSTSFQFDAKTQYAEIEVQGAGGGGGSSATGAGAGLGTAAGGGGAGGYGKKLITVDATVRAATKTITVGAGGASGAAGVATSYGDTVNALTGNAGGAGFNGTFAANIITRYGGVGGAASGGDINISGAFGENGISFGSGNCGANNAACTAGNGADSVLGSGGQGGSAIAGSTATLAPGAAATNYGSGGGGGAATNAVGSVPTGGAGSPGCVIITEYFATQTPPAVEVDATAEARNRIVNPAMQVSQENGNNTGTVTGFYAADQWPYYWIAAGAALAHLRVGGPTPKGSFYRLRCNVNTPKPSLAAGEYMQWLHAIEGIHLADLLWGTVAARQVILRFGIKAPAGTYSIAIRNGALNRCYIQTFVISAGQANLDTEFSFVIPGDTTGTWPIDNTTAMYISITMAAGSSMVAGVTGWQANNFIGLTGMTNGIAASASIELFDVGLYRDPNNTGREPAWQMPDESQELLRCQRYWQMTGYNIWVGNVNNTSSYSVCYTLGPDMRVTPSVAGGANQSNSSFPAAVGTIVGIGTRTVRETRTANATAAVGSFGSSGIIASART